MLENKRRPASPNVQNIGDEMDAAEAFERMQIERIVASDPDSTAYHAAMRKTSTAAPGAIRTQGQFPGVKGQADAIRRKEQEKMINLGLTAAGGDSPGRRR